MITPFLPVVPKIPAVLLVWLWLLYYGQHYDTGAPAIHDALLVYLRQPYHGPTPRLDCAQVLAYHLDVECLDPGRNDLDKDAD
jgi:hypothetical protein